jgi:hypothetical protein
MATLQPDRVFVNSTDDPTESTNPSFNRFTVSMNPGIMGTETCMPLRATIPNVALQIPDYALVFWYWNLPTATTTPSISYLKNVRLVPSLTSISGTYVANQYFNSPADLVNQLNLAAGINGDVSGNNPYWTAGDITFSFDFGSQRIYWNGNTAGRYYAAVGWADPIFAASSPQNNVVYKLANASGGQYTLQPYVAGQSLNLRLGFAMSGACLNNGVGTGTNIRYANLGNLALVAPFAVYSDTYPNLVYSNNVYVYADFILGSTQGSNQKRNLLMCVPVNCPPLGVIQWSAPPLFNFLTKVQSQLDTMTFELLDDNNQPFNLPDSANINIEIGLRYKDTMRKY